MQPLITASNITKYYDQTLALDDFSLSIQPGEIVGLLGPNGAGKTTAIHILVGLLTPTQGTVRVFDMDPFTQRSDIAMRLNFSSAYTSLPTNLTVSENMNIFARLYNVQNHKEKINALLDEFDLTRFRKQLAGALSSGERTRLNLAKCLLNDPQLLLLDEPTASLDPEKAEMIRAKLLSIQKKRQLGILYTSHNMHEVEQVCSRIQFIHHGKTRAVGTPAEVLIQFQSKNLEEVFIKLVRGE